MSSSASNLVWLNLCQQLASVIGFPAYVIACVIYVPCVHSVCAEAQPGFASLGLRVCCLISGCCRKRPAAAQLWLQLGGTAGAVIAGLLFLLMVSLFMLGGMWQVPSVN